MSKDNIKQKHQREKNETTGAKHANPHAAENQVQLTVSLPIAGPLYLHYITRWYSTTGLLAKYSTPQVGDMDSNLYRSSVTFRYSDKEEI